VEQPAGRPGDSVTGNSNRDTGRGKEATLVLAQTQRTRVQRLSSENKGVSPYRPLQAGYRSKRQGLTHIWLHVTLLASSPSVLCDLHVLDF
jgi:hypothetical protein